MHTTTTTPRVIDRWTPSAPATERSGTDRVGDRDRSAMASVLGRALGAGYLDVLEYEDRLEQALAARTSADLGRLTADLPTGVLRDPERVRRAARLAVCAHVAAALLGVVVCWGIWLAVGVGAGAWYPWPVWPSLGAGLAVAGHVAAWRVALNPARSTVGQAG